jgi:hypothetical protein
MILALINFGFLCLVVAPKIVQCLSGSYQAFLLLDLVYKKTWDKLLFCYGIATVLFRQWLNGNVCRHETGYRVSLVLDGELCNFIVKPVVPKIVEIETELTGESLIKDGEARVNWVVQPWKPSQRCIAYLENGETQILE